MSSNVGATSKDRKIHEMLLHDPGSWFVYKYM